VLPPLVAGTAGTGTWMVRGVFAVVDGFAAEAFGALDPDDGATEPVTTGAVTSAGGSPTTGDAGATRGWGSSGMVRASASE